MSQCDAARLLLRHHERLGDVLDQEGARVSGPVQHVVLFKFPKELSPEEENEMFERVRAWPQHIKWLTGLRFGKDETGRSAGFDYLLLTQFDNEEDHQSYYSQDLHVAFSEWVRDRNAEIIRVDYRLTPETLLI
jgi:hypothetical protein